MTVTLTLPIPPRSLSPNARPHYHAKGRATKKARTRAKVEVMATLPAGYRPRAACAKVQITWFAKTRRFPDPDNALANSKAYFDGLTDAGLFCDDKHITHLPVIFQVSKENPRIELTIEI